MRLRMLSERVRRHLASNLLLFMACAGIWGSTWLVIKYQLNGTDPVISVFYRFFISTFLLFIFAKATGKNLSYPLKNHFYFFFQGSCNFSINYIITYWAEEYAPSATIALAFTLLVAYNILGMRIFFQKKTGTNVYVGTALGILGMFFIFHHELGVLTEGSTRLRGLGLGLLATFFASAGNLLAYKNHLLKVPVTIANLWGMFYGTITTLVIALVLNKAFVLTQAPTYWLSLLYLSVFGTVIAFGAYLTLVARIGAEKAAYSSILSPMIALILSVVFEKYTLSPSILLGLLFCILGIWITLKSKKISLG